MRYASAFSGIGTDAIAWHPLGWQCAWFAETEKFPCEVLKQRFPGVPNLGDVTEIGAKHGPVDLLVGGPPCQSFSVAGKRKGMDDPRGNLALEFLALADRLRARWFVFENVPGLLSSNGGRDFAQVLRAVSEHGYGAFWRVLDAQNFGVPQRRRRVFLVGYLGDWRPPAAVLLERDCLRGNTAKGKKTGAEIAGTLEAHLGKGGAGAHEAASGYLVPLSISMRTRDGEPQLEFSETQSALRGSNGGSSRSFVYAPHQYRQDSIYPIDRPANALAASRTRTMQSYDTPCGVRRLTPQECERLQGLPDSWTEIAWRGKPPEKCPDGPRYRAIGNGMAMPVLRWIGERIQLVEDMNNGK